MGRRALVLVVALLLAGVAAFAVFQYLQGITEEVEAGQTQVTVYRALRAIEEGTEGDFLLQGEGTLWEEGTEEQEDLPQDAITSRDQLRDVLTGKVAAGPVSANDIFTTSQWVTLTVDITPLAELIPEGKQAITIAPSAVEGVNGFVQPGDRINAIVTLDIEFDLTAIGEGEGFGIPTEEPEGEEGTDETEEETVRYTRYVMQGLPVLAVGRSVRPDEDAPERIDASDPGATAQAQTQDGEGEEQITTVFTLEVTPEQAERLVFAQDAGSLYFTLVPTDFVEVSTRGVTIDTLFDGDLVQDIFGN